MYSYKLAAPIRAFFLPEFVARILTPQSRNSGYDELLLECRPGLDWGPFEDDFLFAGDVETTQRKIFTFCSGPLSQSIGRGRISREGALAP